LLFMGIIGEYVGNIQTQVQKRPLVFERDRINFDIGPGEPLQVVISTSNRATPTPT